MSVYQQVVSDLLRLHPDAGWGLTIGSYGSSQTNPYWKSLLAMNIKMKSAVRNDHARYTFLSSLIGRPITSSKQMTVAEVKAFLRLFGEKL